MHILNFTENSVFSLEVPTQANTLVKSNIFGIRKKEVNLLVNLYILDPVHSLPIPSTDPTEVIQSGNLKKTPVQ